MLARVVGAATATTAATAVTAAIAAAIDLGLRRDVNEQIDALRASEHRLIRNHHDLANLHEHTPTP